MSDRHELVVTSTLLPMVVQHRMEIAESVTEAMEKREIEIFFREFPELFKQTLAWNYPLASEHIFSYAPAWDWSPLLMNDKIHWTKELVIACQEFIDWSSLSEQARINGLKWNAKDSKLLKSPHFWEYLSKFGQLGGPEDFGEIAEHLNFPELSKRDAQQLFFSNNIAEFKNRWDWSALSANVSLPWSAHFVSQFREHWDWIVLSDNEALPWSLDLIGAFESEWNWEVLSTNSAVPWSNTLLDQFADQWDWDWLSITMGNSGQAGACPAMLGTWLWTDDAFARYCDRWSWEYLSSSSGIPWSIHLIDKYLERWDWLALSCNESLPWSVELIDRFLARWCFAGDEDCGGLSQNESLPWTAELIGQFEDRWDWDYLSTNKALPWSAGLIESYVDNWLFGSFDDSLSYVGNQVGVGLSGNRGIPFSITLVEKFADRWDWRQLSRNRSFQITDEMLDRFADRIDLRRPNLKGFASEAAIERHHKLINFNWLIWLNPPLTRNLYRRFTEKFDSRWIAGRNSFEIEKLDRVQVDRMLREILKRRDDFQLRDAPRS